MKILVIIIGIIIAISGITLVLNIMSDEKIKPNTSIANQSELDQSKPNTEPEQSKSEQLTNRDLLDPRIAKIGEEFSGLKITKLETFEWPEIQEDTMFDIIRIEFDGVSQIITGKYEVQDPDSESSGVYLFVDENADFPKIQVYEDGSEKAPSQNYLDLGFDDQSQEDLFGEPGARGYVKLRVSNYKFIHAPNDERSSADIEEIIKVILE